MKDFTLDAYRLYLQAIKSSYQNMLTFAEFFITNPRPKSFCLIRHDVDRRPKRALRMARFEKECGVRATYYFRAKSHVFKPEIIKEISNLGHEIGYHYESLSDTNGDIALGLKDFEKNLKEFREIVPIKTISMHGRPFKRFDNLDMWRDAKNHSLLLDKYGILGDVYLDIDYREIAYINDTGRNWSSTRSNIRDRVDSGIELDFKGWNDLHNYLRSNASPQLVFQVHPERWSIHIMDYCLVFCFDIMANIGKAIANVVTDKRHGT
jgi:hypothetical protein